jgi:hypothetical protein
MVSNILAGDGKNENLFLQCKIHNYIFVTIVKLYPRVHTNEQIQNWLVNTVIDLQKREIDTK